MKTITRCLKGFANSLPECAESSSDDYPLSSCSFFDATDAPARFPISNYTAGSLKPSSASSCIKAFCDYATRAALVSGDIAGIGVYISYLMQIAIALTSWGLLKWWHLHLHSVLRQMLRKVFFGKPALEVQAADRLEQRHDTHKDRLLEAVVDFQKSQCYFMLPIQISALISINTGGLSAETLQQVFNNYAFLMVLSIGGFLPVTLILFVLRTLGYKSFYTTLLSMASVALSGATLFKASRFTYVPSALRPPSGVHYPGCANISPVSYCLSGAAGSFFGNLGAVGATGPIPAFIFSTLVLVFICLEHSGIQDIRALRPLREWTLKEKWQHEEDPEHPANRSLPARKWFCFLRRILRITSPKAAREKAQGFFDLAVTVLYIYFFAVYIVDLSVFRGSGSEKIPLDSNSWSFGQIIAITVWAPSLIQYAYLELSKSQNETRPFSIYAFLHRIHVATYLRRRRISPLALLPWSSRGHIPSPAPRSVSLSADGHAH